MKWNFCVYIRSFIHSLNLKMQISNRYNYLHRVLCTLRGCSLVSNDVDQINLIFVNKNENTSQLIAFRQRQSKREGVKYVSEIEDSFPFDRNVYARRRFDLKGSSSSSLCATFCILASNKLT